MIGVGDRVVCVDASPHRGTGEAALVLDRVYTVEGGATGDDGALHLILVGEPQRCGCGCARVIMWHVDRFRKVEDTKEPAGMEVFREMLTTKPDRAVPRKRQKEDA